MADLNEIDERFGQSHSTSTDGKINTYRLPWSKYDEIFKVISLKEDFESYQKYIVRCKYCASSKVLTADTRTSSNLLKHLEMQHKNVWTSTTKHKRKSDSRNCDEKNLELYNELKIEEKKSKVTTILDFSKRCSSISQNELNLMIQNVIINASLPFNLVEQIDFENLITTGYPGRHVLSRKTLMKNIETQHQVLLQNMKSIFSKVDHLTTTADCWTIFKRSYLGMTCHWINPESLERESCLLAIRRLKGSHTYDLLAKTMESIYSEFNISDKVIYTTTDNGSNFVKCFEIFGQSSRVGIIQNDGSKNTDIEILETLDVLEEEEDENKEDTDSEMNEDGTFSRISISNVLDNRELMGECSSNWDDYIVYNLPKHHRCASHTLNLIATADIEKALSPNVSKGGLSMSNYRKQSRLTFSKCQALWNKQNRSSQMADVIKTNLGVYLKTPNQTRWNCWFDSSKFLLFHFKSSPSKFTQVCDVLKLNRFSKNDLEFLEEYVVVMEPLCICLDVLQSEKHMYFGFLLPSITILLQKYNDLSKKHLIYCDSLVNLIKTNVEKRFKNFLTDPFLLSATVSHPFFKTIWLTNNDEKDKALSFFKKSCLEMFEQSNLLESEVSDSNISDDANNYFNWSENKSKLDLSLEQEITNFLSKNPTKNLSILKEMPTIKKVFLKFNTPLPSSAAVERIFSIGGAVLSKKRGRMNDKNFENVLMLKCNKSLIKY